jgi:hypothetical protein
MTLRSEVLEPAVPPPSGVKCTVESRTLEYVNPQAYLDVLFSQRGSYFELLRDTHERTPSSFERPWRVILYADEVDPGNVLAHRHMRKVWSFYMSVLEFGAFALSNEEAWITLATKPTHETSTISGGISQIMKVILLSLFHGTFRADCGLTFVDSTTGHVMRIFLDVGVFLLDGAAHKLLWHTKGDNGMRFCLMCENLFTHYSEIAHHDATRTLVCDILSLDGVIRAKDADIRASLQRLAAAHAAGDDYDRRSQAAGFNHEPHNLITEPRLTQFVRPTEQFCHDGMHGMLAGGVLNTTALLTLEAAAAALGNNVYEACEDYVQRHTWPLSLHHTSKNLHDVFSPARCDKHRKNGAIGCQASEMLALMMVLASFAREVLGKTPALKDYVDCFIAACDVVATFFDAAYGCVTGAMLRLKITIFMDLFEACGWGEHAHAKFHWLLHMPEHLDKWEFALTCFVTERKHRLVKRFAAFIQNTRTYQQSVLREVTAAHITSMRERGAFTFSVGLVDAVHAAPRKLKLFLEERLGCDLRRVDTARTARYGARGKACVRDIVLFQMDGAPDLCAGEVWAHARYDDVNATLVSCWRSVAVDRAAGTALWERHDGDPQLVHTHDILHACIYRALRDARYVQTLLPRFLCV